MSQNNIKSDNNVSVKLQPSEEIYQAETAKPLIPHKNTTPEYFDNLATKSRKRNVRNYYTKQAELLRNFAEDKTLLQTFIDKNYTLSGKPRTSSETSLNAMKGETQDERKHLCDQFVTNATLTLNVFLLVVKIIAAYLSGSLVIISSVIDSAVDITSGAVIWLTSRAIRNRDPYLYPRGRTRLEPLAVVLVSVIMGVANLQMISKSLEDMATGNISVHVDAWTISIMCLAIVAKFILYFVCRCFPSTATTLLAQDHRNDCISNSAAIACAFLADKYWIYLDPIGAICVSLYICFNWYLTGHQHVGILSGRSAQPEFYSRIIRVVVEHEPLHITQICTVQVYHYGTQFLVEVDIVVDRNMPVHQAHDISEQLQRKVEHLPYVERSFVHVDYEATQRPEMEHKIV